MMRFNQFLKYKKNHHMSPVTQFPFPARAQEKLDKVISKKGYTSRYWISGAQADRVYNVKPLPNEKAYSILFDVKRVTSLEYFITSDQQRILDEHPPFFTGGVGILGGSRNRWLPVGTAKLRTLLNPLNKERSLWIDEELIELWGLKMKSEFINPMITSNNGNFTDLETIHDSAWINIDGFSSFEVYNANQFEDPNRIVPLEGLALSALTGKRFSQPAHDLLVEISILRGYPSPFWLSARMENIPQIFGTRFISNWKEHIVVVPSSEGVIIPYSFLPQIIQKRIIMFSKSDLPLESKFYKVFGTGGWESIKLTALVNAIYTEIKNFDDFIFKVEGQEIPFSHPKLWVNINQLNCILSKEEMESIYSIDKLKQNNQYITINSNNSFNVNIEAYLSDYSNFKIPYIELSKVCQYTLINASLTKEPQYVVPKNRIIQIKNGRLFGDKSEAELRLLQLNMKYPAPIWLSRREALTLGVGIKINEKGIVLGKDIREMGTLYNIEDIEKYKLTVLEQFPISLNISNSNRAIVFEGLQWRIEKSERVNNILKKSFIENNRKNNIWIAATEILGHAFPLKSGSISVTPQKVSNKQSIKKVTSDTKLDLDNELFNVSQTTDPIRVMAKSTYFVRPQGTLI